MIKEFEINDILNAVNSISKIDKKKIKTVEKKDLVNKDGNKLCTLCNIEYEMGRLHGSDVFI